MKNVIRNVVGLFVLVLCSTVMAADKGMVVENAWVREAPPGVTALAGYMTIDNPTAKEVVLVGASSSDFKNVMLHRTIVEDGVAKMVHQMKITIPAKGKLTFEPNGYHVMLMGPKHTLKAGDKVEITLKFKGGKSIKVVYEVRKGAPSGSMEHGMGGMSM